MASTTPATAAVAAAVGGSFPAYLQVQNGFQQINEHPKIESISSGLGLLSQQLQQQVAAAALSQESMFEMMPGVIILEAPNGTSILY